MTKKAKQAALAALDTLALALTMRRHVWTPQQRRSYEAAVRSLSR